MKLFGDLLKKEAKKMLSEALTGQKHNSNQHDSGQSTGQSSTNRSGDNDETDVKERIRRVIADHYSAYEVKENVSPVEFGGTRGMSSFSFVMYQGGVARLTILVLYDSNGYRRKAVRQAHEISEQAGAKCINIMQYFPSTYDYINRRIQENP